MINEPGKVSDRLVWATAVHAALYSASVLAVGLAEGRHAAVVLIVLAQALAYVERMAAQLVDADVLEIASWMEWAWAALVTFSILAAGLAGVLIIF